MEEIKYAVDFYCNFNYSESYILPERIEFQNNYNPGLARQEALFLIREKLIEYHDESISIILHMVLDTNSGVSEHPIPV